MSIRDKVLYLDKLTVSSTLQGSRLTHAVRRAREMRCTLPTAPQNYHDGCDHRQDQTGLGTARFWPAWRGLNPDRLMAETFAA